MRSTDVDTGVTEESPAVSAGNRTVSGTIHKKIWIDLDNSPHVPFFLPIIEELRVRGYQVFVTARDSYQVCELLALHNLRCEVIGRHWGKNKLFKILATCARTVQLLPVIVKHKPDLAVSHGSRAQALASRIFRIPTIAMWDYEFTQKMEFLHSVWFLTPEYIPDSADLKARARMRKYPGLKEDVYVSRFRPDPSLRDQLGITADQVMITVRPPATEAHYHNPEAEVLLEAAMNLFMERAESRVVLLPRNERQAVRLRKTWGPWISRRKVLIPEHAVDGLNLVWSSDLVVSGGGTMNREAAALGVPVYSIFRGPIGAVDRYLVQQGRLILIENVDDVRTKIILASRDRSAKPRTGNRPALEVIVNNIISILDSASQTQSQGAT
jgi:predicted glycosyltransferase